MRGDIRRALWLLAHLAVPLRYRIRFLGRERVRGLKGPVPPVPNHPGSIDPILFLNPILRDLPPEAGPLRG
jgi:hypothetical protein